MRLRPARHIERRDSVGASDGTIPGVVLSAPDRDPRQDREPTVPSLAPGGPRGIFGETFCSLFCRLLRRLIRRLSGGRSPGSRAVAPARRLAPAGIAAALPIVLTALFAAPVQAQSHCDSTDPDEIWCATLTVGVSTIPGGREIIGYRTTSPVIGSISPNTFTRGSVTVKVNDLFYQTVSGSERPFTLVVLRNDGTPSGGSLLGSGRFTLEVGTGASKKSFTFNNPSSNHIQFSNHGLSWSNNEIVSVKLLGPGATPSQLQLDAPSGTAGFLRVRWEAEASSAEAYHVRAHPTVDTFGQRAKYLTGNRLVRADADARDYTFYALVPGITYRVQVCRVTAIHTLVHNERTHSVPSFDTRGGCSPWQSIRLPAAADADANDVKVSLEFPDGSETTTLTPETHGTLNYRVRLSGINDLSQYRSPRWGAGSWTLFLKPSESRKTHRLGPGYGQVPEYFGHVARGANLSHLTWDRPGSGYIDQEFTLTSTQRSRGPLIVELFDHRTNDRHTDLGSQRKLCVDFEDAMGDVADPCPSAGAGGSVGGSSQRSAGPTATFQDVPESHDGATAFKLDLRFSGAPAGLNAKRDAASVLEVTGGSVTKARQTEAGANPVWEVTVTPDGAGEVTVRVPARACSETHAVCIGGQPLGEAAEAAVPGPAVTGPAMTASFTQAPASHDGSSAFELTFAFSHAPTGYSWSTVRDRLFEVTGGRIEKAGRLVKGSNLGWTVRVVPDGDGDVTLNARATTDCAAQYAACDAEGRRFDGELETTVAGPAGIAEAQATVSIAAPATTPVTEGTPLDFTLTRTGATDAGLTVSVSVSESGAVLGNAPPTTVTFAANSATATLSVPTVDDDAEEDASTVTVTVTAGTGYAVDADAGSASASGTVESEDVGPITARFTQVPAEHDGSDAFEMRFAFSHAPTGYNWTTVRDRLFEVTGGRIEKAGRLVRGSNLGWKLRVRPDGLGPVTLDARATTDCAAPYAACDAAGRRFDGELRTTVQGPPTLSVADAEVEEADGATLDFVVTLSRAIPETVTVAYATSDGTAAASDDYTAANGTLTFAASEVTRTVSVQVLDDAHNEGSETVTFTLSNPDPARVKLADAEATGTITNTDAMPRAWLARFGRAVAERHVAAVRDRLRADRSPGFTGRFAGQPLPGPAGTEGTGPGPDSPRESRTASLVSSTEGAVPAFRAPALPEDERLAFRSLLADADEGEDAEGTRTLAADDVLLGTSFAMMQDSGTGLSTGFWGRAARSGFGGRDGETDLDGEVTSVMLGTDWKRKGTLFGLIVSGSRGTGTYDGASPGAKSCVLDGESYNT